MNDCPLFTPGALPGSRLAPLAALAVMAALCGGCAVGPVYQRPLVPLPARWQAPLPAAADAAPNAATDAATNPATGATTPDATAANPADWWARFDDPAVATLVRWADADSPTLDKALAAIASARATLDSSNAAGVPTLSGSGSVLRSRQAVSGIPAVTTTLRSAGLDAGWEIDLFGRLRRGREAAAARVEARLADFGTARSSLAAEVADDYVQYRACRRLEAAYADQATSLQETARITAVAVAAGFSAPADNDLADASAASANATRIDQQTSCELLVKALVTLTGAAEPTLRQAIDMPGTALPSPPALTVASVPAALLRQRPDVAAAERTLAAASADIGQAEANRYPSLSLGGSITLAASSGTSALTSWSLGPALSLPLFDGGTRRAAVASAQAAYDSAAADYRSTVRSAVLDVEQALVQLDGAARRSSDATAASASYRRYYQATDANWRAGGTTLLSLEEARRSSISAETTLLALQRDQLRQFIALYKALGGGWDATAGTFAPAPATAAQPPTPGPTTPGPKAAGPTTPVSERQP